MSQNKALIALDVGEKRIGIAAADGNIPIAKRLGFIEVDGTELEQIVSFVANEKAATVVIGYPRNQSGETTAQTAYVESFKNRLSQVIDTEIVFSDESLTSVLAEERLRSFKSPYSRGDIDAEAAAIILEDYLGVQSGRI